MKMFSSCLDCINGLVPTVQLHVWMEYCIKLFKKKKKGMNLTLWLLCWKALYNIHDHRKGFSKTVIRCNSFLTVIINNKTSDNNNNFTSSHLHVIRKSKGYVYMECCPVGGLRAQNPEYSPRLGCDKNSYDKKWGDGVKEGCW